MNVDHTDSVGRGSCTQILLILFFLFLGTTYSAGAQGPELLEPEKAFRISSRALDARNVEVRFRIADGYYMYRGRFRFETEDGALLADAEFPKGQMKEDEFFGRTETYRREVRIRVPISAADLNRGSVRLKVTSQGCADVGVCYVPLVQLIDVPLGGGSSIAPAATLLPAPSPAENVFSPLRRAPAAVPDGGTR